LSGPDGGDNPIIVALDHSQAGEALKLVESLAPEFDFFKVGSTLFVSEGPAIVRSLRAAGARVFLDLKFHDIPEQVAGAVAAVSDVGVAMLTVHCLGGKEMLEAAASAARSAGHDHPAVLGVTVLTSHGDDLNEIGVVASAKTEVLRLATLALDAGLDGVVASAGEATLLRENLGNDFLIVTPGIRLSGGESADQKRVATPRGAVAAGADFLVVGRPIRNAADPREAAMEILREARREALRHGPVLDSALRLHRVESKGLRSNGK